MRRRFVIVGAGQTGAAAAQTLRKEGFEGDIVIIGDEPHPPYERPPLSKEYLAGDASADELAILEEGWLADNDVDLRLGSKVTDLRASERMVALDDGTTVGADAVLIATGGRPRTLAGVEGERVLALRRIEDADAIAAWIGAGRHLVVVGAGFIGSEVAATARTHGTDVTVLEALSLPLERALPQRLGEVCAAIHRDEGVDLRTGEGVTAVAETAGGVRVTTTSGAVVEGDAVVVGIGIIPNVEIAATTGLELGNGIRVDAACRTSLEAVFAAGDVAEQDHPLFGRVRVEHFDNAKLHGSAAARSMLGQAVSYDDPLWFWSDQYDLNLQHVGRSSPDDDLVLRGDVDDRDFTAFFLRGRRLTAAFAIDRGGDILVARHLIANRSEVDPVRLADDDVDLAELLDL